MDTVVETVRGRNAKTEVEPSKHRHINNSRLFHIGQCELRVDGADLPWLNNEIEDRMLIRKDDGASATFKEFCRFLRGHNVISKNLMVSTGDAY